MLASGRLFVATPVSGRNLVDANATLTPGTDGIARYLMLPGVQTADRTIQLSNAGTTATQIVDILRPGPNAHALTINDGLGALLFTIPANESLGVELYKGAGGQWVLSILWYIRPLLD